MHARPFIDSLDFASNSNQISGVVLVAELSRLTDLLSDTAGELSYEIHGAVDAHGVPKLDLRLDGRCRLICQRCMQEMEYPVHVLTTVLLRDQATLDLLDESEIDEEYESILAEAHMDVWGWLEDEIILSLPFAPKHEVGECQTQAVKQQSDETHPFAALAKLKS